MTSPNGAPQAPPTAEEIAALKRLAAGIVRAQGNRFIKELLREKSIPIGVNKADFERNLGNAIDSGQLRLADVEQWLDLVEGWGNQHVYLFEVSPTLRKDLTQAKIRKRVTEAGLDRRWNASTTLAFPEGPTLTSISFDDSVLRLVWQEASPAWTRVPEKDFQQAEGLDLFEYRAHRMIEQRAITRFEVRLDKGLAALFVAAPIVAAEHRAAIEEAKRVIGLLMNHRALEAARFDISRVSRNLDQRSLPTNVDENPDVRTQKSRLAAGDAYVEFAAFSPERAYWEETAVGEVRRGLRGEPLEAFEGTDGVFIFTALPNAAGKPRRLRVQLYGDDDRIRLWAQMDVEEVWALLERLKGYRA